MGCTDEPTILPATWDRIRDEQWHDGGWMIDSSQWRIYLHKTDDNTFEWVAWDEDGPPPPPPPDYILCTMSEDDYELIRGGDLDTSENWIENDPERYCISYVATGGEHYARVLIQ